MNLLKRCPLIAEVDEDELAKLHQKLPMHDSGASGAFELPEDFRRLCVLIRRCEQRIREVRRLLVQPNQAVRCNERARADSNHHEELQHRALLGSVMLTCLQPIAPRELGLGRVRKGEPVVLKLAQGWIVRLRERTPGAVPPQSIEEGILPLCARVKFVSQVPGAVSPRGNRVAMARPF